MRRILVFLIVSLLDYFVGLLVACDWLERCCVVFFVLITVITIIIIVSPRETEHGVSLAISKCPVA